MYFKEKIFCHIFDASYTGFLKHFEIKHEATKIRNIYPRAMNECLVHRRQHVSEDSLGPEALPLVSRFSAG